MIVQIFVPQRQAIHPLRHQLLHPVLDQIRIAVVRKAAGKLPDQPDPLVHLPQQQSSPVTADRSPVKLSPNLPLWTAPLS